MMQGLVDMPDGVKVLPFVRMFYGTPSQFLWEDELGTVNHIPQGEGDPLMPLLFSLGQHRAITSVTAECMFTAQPDCGGHLPFLGHPFVAPGGSHCTRARQSSGIRLGSVHGVAIRWRMPPGAQIPTQSRGEGTFFSNHSSRVSLFWGFQWAAEFILAKLEAKSRQHNVLLDRITSVIDLQSAWCLLLYCAAARVNFWSVPPELSGEFAREHDAGVWRCMCQLLHINPA